MPARKKARARRSKAANGDTSSTATALTEDQQWEQDQRERAEKKRDEVAAEQDRRTAMSPQEREIDDRKKAADAQKEAERWNALSQEEKNAEMDDESSPNYDPLPPWQHRVGIGKVIDARMQRFDLIYTDGTLPSGGDRQEALRFCLEYMTSDEDETEDKDE